MDSKLSGVLGTTFQRRLTAYRYGIAIWKYTILIATSQHEKGHLWLQHKCPKMILYTGLPEVNTICTQPVISYHISDSSSRILGGCFYYGFDFMPGMRTFRFWQGFLLSFLWISHKYANYIHDCWTTSKTQTQETPQASKRFRKHKAPIRQTYPAMGSLSASNGI